ncbi:ABC transporter permease [Allonocardiopsis opalescens]|uniref:Transport permease protein n=1 Tax=Allonocardiopsis opalescens TaxID=1144618 RepID=A0A2T0Q2M7_9ACTN|nr:ABC transporter permease [Allonocardiopsis opalescens]PRX98039.1 ABC-2 type transport system permease protein [Allonocardiopsis opalescens]
MAWYWNPGSPAQGHVGGWGPEAAGRAGALAEHAAAAAVTAAGHAPARAGRPEAGPEPDPPEAAWSGTGIAAQVLVLTGRSLRAVVLDPRLLLASLFAPMVMLVLFSQLFASVAAAPGFPDVRYIDFLVPAILVTSAIQAALNTGLGLTQEMSNGIITRFRTLPVWPGSVLLARSLADVVRNAVQLLLVVVAAAAVFGFRPAGGPLGTLGACALALAVGGCLGWIFIALACWLRRVELMQSVAGLVTFPLVFASTAFVPASGLPGWLRAVAQVNPATYGIEAARGLALGQPALLSAAIALAISLTVAAAAAAVAIRGFQRRR